MGKLVAVFLIVILLAGCAGGGGDESTSTGTAASSGSVSSKSGLPGGNNPPTGKVEASIAQGQAPLRVDFTMDGSDKDKDALSWSLDVNGDGKVDRNGNKLPATANYTYMSPGVFNVTYLLDDGKSKVTFPLAITVTANVSNRTALLSDGAEAAPTAWVFTNELVIDTVATKVRTGQEHPQGGWVQTADEAHMGSQSYHAPYPDHYEAKMTTAAPIPIPEGGATLTFWLKGGAEDNSYDGLYVNSGTDPAALENQVYQAAAFAEWTQFSFTLEPGDQTVEFVFKADASCSSDPEPVGGPGACGPGWELGGYWIDDITLS